MYPGHIARRKRAYDGRRCYEGCRRGREWRAARCVWLTALQSVQPGCVPRILEGLLEARDRVKAALARCHPVRDAALRAVLDHRQTALKVLLSYKWC